MKSKKITYTLFISLLALILVACLGYNILEQREESKRLEKLKNKTNEVVQQEPTEETEETETIPNENGRIICIGDSVTLGTSNQYSYPKLLSTKTNKEVFTFGGANDTSLDASARIGAYPLYTNAIVIPQEGEVNVKIYDKHDDLIKPFINSEALEVTIAEIVGSLKYNKEKEVYTFTRKEAGEAVNVPSDTQIIMAPFVVNPEKDIVIIFTGNYDAYGPDSIFDTITHQLQIIRTLQTDNYIIVGLTARNRFERISSMNDLIEQNHDEGHFLDIRTYLLENGLKEAEIEATEEDLENVRNGFIPASLLADSINGNTKFNQILANQLVEKMLELEFLRNEDIIEN